MKYTPGLALAAFVVAAIPLATSAATVNLSVSGPGVSANLTVTYGPQTDAKYADAFVVTGISGSFSDAAAGVSNATVLGLVKTAFNVPDATNLLAPANFSRFAVASGLAPLNNGYLSYDNLFLAGRRTANGQRLPAYGGMLNIYGLLFRIGDGKVVNLWSNGVFGGPAVGPIYGAAVATVDQALSYHEGLSVSAVPEPTTTALLLLGLGVTGWAARRQRAARRD